MKKTVKMFGLALTLIIVGVAGVSAASQVIYSSTGYSINSGGAVSVVNKSASNNIAKANMTIDGAKSGTKNTKYIAYRLESGSLVKKATKITGYALYTCNLITIGTVGRGTWTISNQAFDGSTTYAGWNGSLQYSSVS